VKLSGNYDKGHIEPETETDGYSERLRLMKLKAHIHLSVYNMNMD
jgi:hypothetical protein